MLEREPYSGLTRELLLGIDVGTTYSGISFSVLDPGEVPLIKHITRFPAQERAGADSKIPTIAYYDQDGNARAFGAEALDEAIKDRADEEGWQKIEWFKLYLAKSPLIHKKLAPLPVGKTVTDVFADFFAYLFKSAESYITETLHNGASIWEGVRRGQVRFVITHPNAWEGSQQTELRKAAVQAKLIPDTVAGHARIQFVTEGEASLHFCLQQGFDDCIVKGDGGVLIIDAGGGTIDLSAYAPTSFEGKIGFEEVAAPHCRFNGSVFVNTEARKQLTKKLKDSKFFDDIDEIMRQFDTSTKITFRNPNDPSFIPFGRPRDNDASCGIRNGRVRLSGQEVASYFEPSIRSIISAVTSIGFSANSISRALLVGGYAASDYLYNRLKIHFASLGVEVLRPDSHVNKAVSDGAVGYFIDHHVSVRVARYSLGMKVHIPYDPNNPEHAYRLDTLYTDVDGSRRIAGAYSTILEKNTKIKETQEFKKPYFSTWSSLDDAILRNHISRNVGMDPRPDWWDTDPTKFEHLCTIEIGRDIISRIARRGGNGSRRFYRLDYSVVIQFGLTELQAQVVWRDKGIEKRSPATILYAVDESPVVYSNSDDEVEESDWTPDGWETFGLDS